MKTVGFLKNGVEAEGRETAGNAGLFFVRLPEDAEIREK